MVNGCCDDTVDVVTNQDVMKWTSGVLSCLEIEDVDVTIRLAIRIQYSESI